jgi:predicted amidohydrolase
VNVIAIQMDIAWENKEKNFVRARELIMQANPVPGSLVILPEMFATGFSMNAQAIAENYGGVTEKFLGSVACEFKVWILAGLAARSPSGIIRNKALVFSEQGKLAGFYAKMRPFRPGNEHFHYQAGRHPLMFSWNGFRVCPFICYDLRFPELFRDAAARWQPELFVVVANFPKKRGEHWNALLKARAIENQAYVVGVNRIGTDPFYSYAGHSQIISPEGTILGNAATREGCVSATLDREKLRKYREGLPFLAELETPDSGAEGKRASSAFLAGSQAISEGSDNSSIRKALPPEANDIIF